MQGKRDRKKSVARGESKRWTCLILLILSCVCREWKDCRRLFRGRVVYNGNLEWKEVSADGLG